MQPLCPFLLSAGDRKRKAKVVFTTLAVVVLGGRDILRTYL